MTDFLIIVIIALAVFVVGVIIILAKSSARREKAWREVVRRKEQDLKRAELFRKEAEGRYNSLVEDVSRRTDQAKEGK